MQILTVWQPWAWAISAGIKLVENRDWLPSWRTLQPGDELAIHAAKKPVSSSDYLTMRSMARAAGRIADVPTIEAWLGGASMVKGAIVAVVRFDGVVRGVDELPAAQRPFWVGRYGWQLSNVRQLREPIPCRGQQGLFPIEARDEARLFSVLSQKQPADPMYGTYRRTAP